MILQKGQQSNTGRTHFKKGSVPWNKGKRGLYNHSETTRKKISKAIKKSWSNFEYREKASKRMLGNKLSVGRKHSEKWYKVMKDFEGYWLGKKRPDMTGENNPRWVNGNYKRDDRRNDSAYIMWVKEVKDRDDWKCKIDKDCLGKVFAHHILPWRDFPELRYEINNGITLCQVHHPRKRVEEQRLIPFFKEMVGSKELI